MAGGYRPRVDVGEGLVVFRADDDADGDSDFSQTGLRHGGPEHRGNGECCPDPCIVERVVRVADRFLHTLVVIEKSLDVGHGKGSFRRQGADVSTELRVGQQLVDEDRDDP